MKLRTLYCLAAGALLTYSWGQSPATQWIKHTDPQRYSVDSPPGWTLTADKGNG